MRFNRAAVVVCLGLLLDALTPSQSESLQSSRFPEKEKINSDRSETERKLGNQQGNIFERVSTSNNDVLMKRGQTLEGDFQVLYDGRSDIDKNGEYMILGDPDISGVGFAYIYKYDSAALRYFLHQTLQGDLTGEQFGLWVAMSCDTADAIAIITAKASGQDDEAGSVKMFRKDNSGFFVQNSEFFGSAANEHYGGGGVQISCDGSVVMVGTCTTPCGGGAASYIDFYKFDQNTATYYFMQTIGEVDYGWGKNIALSGDGTKAVVGSTTANGWRGSATFYGLDTSVNQYAQIDIMHGPVVPYPMFTTFGHRVALSYDGNQAVVSAIRYSNGGAVFLLRFDHGLTNKYETVQIITGGEFWAGISYFGNGLAISSDGSTVIAGSRPTQTMIVLKLNPDSSLKCFIIAPNAGWGLSMRNHEYALAGRTSDGLFENEVSVWLVPNECPTEAPTTSETEEPSDGFIASNSPTEIPSLSPFVLPGSPSHYPSEIPSPGPFDLPDSPSANPDQVPSPRPFALPDSPSKIPSEIPSLSPFFLPDSPSATPDQAPSPGPFALPDSPSASPVSAPTKLPSSLPTRAPIRISSIAPTLAPTHEPTPEPTKAPVTGTSCSRSKKFLVITINADDNGTENKITVKKQKKNGKGWSKKKFVDKKKFPSNKTTIITKCLPKKKCYQFKIIDKGNDGICCEHGEGSYTIEWKGKEVAKSKFKNGRVQSLEFNCV